MAAQLARDVPSTAQEVVQFAIDHGDSPWSVRQLAASLGVPRKTLDRRLAKAITLTARELIGWARLIALAIRLESSTMSADGIAIELRFASPSAMRNLLQRYAGLTPTELRQRGGSEYLYGRLRAELRRVARAS
jgi:transcriptional regulator GlxA family with amidase domain